MRVHLGRHKPPTKIGLPLASHPEVDRVCADSRTGCLEVTASLSGSMARLFFVDGQVYAIELMGYDVPVGRRLVSAGLIDARQLAQLEHESDPDSTHASLGRMALERGWITADSLANIHQEFLLAGLGAVLECSEVTSRFVDGAMTNEVCTMPLNFDELQQAARIRRRRMSQEWEQIAPASSVSEITWNATGVLLPTGFELPEFASLLAALALESSLDKAANALGLTRAEATHLVVGLVHAGVVEIGEGTGLPCESILVPEAFDQVPFHADITPLLQTQQLVLDEFEEPEESAEESEPQNLPPSIVEVAVLPVPLLAVAPVLDGGGDFAIATLRAELVAAESQARQVRERLEAAIARRAALRE
ncbi:MAG: hypothetical protein Q7L55_05760 [Actinomycetota bacterium]|nr:hypothetical protein [Actinomycetota bacterium]